MPQNNERQYRSTLQHTVMLYDRLLHLLRPPRLSLMGWDTATSMNPAYQAVAKLVMVYAQHGRGLPDAGQLVPCRYPVTRGFPGATPKSKPKPAREVAG